MAARFLLALIIFFNFTHSSLAQLGSVSGRLINGRGTAEKLDRVRIAMYAEKELIGSAYTNAEGEFQINLSSVADDETAPVNFRLFQNYPNPFSPITTIQYSLPRSGLVTIDIFNILGQKVRTLVNNSQSSGIHSIHWDGKNETGQLCQSGMYFYRLRFEGKIEIKKMCFWGTTPFPAQSGSNTGAHSLLKPTFETIEIQITDRDISDTTLVVEYDNSTSSLDLESIHIHVHPFVRSLPDTLNVMSGEAANDTLDIYFERPIEISSTNAEVEWNFTEDSLVAISYSNVYQTPVYVSIREINGAKVSYGLTYFNLSPRLGLVKPRLRRGYIGIPYSEYVLAKNASGLAQLTFLNTVPQNLVYENQQISGIPSVPFEAPLFFQLVDNRNIQVLDSTYLIIREPTDIDMNGYAVDILEEYPRDGTHPYSWVNTYTGVTRDLYYKGELIAWDNPNGSKSCYCCGLTFEDFFRAMQQLNSDLNLGEDINGMTAADMRYFIHLWFVQSTWGDGPGIALRYFGLGDNISQFNDVKKGDYVQLWRTTGSGHSVIFINWTTNAAGDTTGIRYWSTQGSTNGINYNTEYFDGYGGTVNPDVTYFSRVFSPEYFSPFLRAKLENYDEVVSGKIPLFPRSFMKNE